VLPSLEFFLFGIALFFGGSHAVPDRRTASCRVIAGWHTPAHRYHRRSSPPVMADQGQSTNTFNRIENPPRAILCHHLWIRSGPSEHDGALAMNITPPPHLSLAQPLHSTSCRRAELPAALPKIPRTLYSGFPFVWTCGRNSSQAT